MPKSHLAAAVQKSHKGPLCSAAAYCAPLVLSFLPVEINKRLPLKVVAPCRGRAGFFLLFFFWPPSFGFHSVAPLLRHDPFLSSPAHPCEAERHTGSFARPVCSARPRASELRPTAAVQSGLRIFFPCPGFAICAHKRPQAQESLFPICGEIQLCSLEIKNIPL